MRASIVIPAHNEGSLLAKTVASTAECLRYEKEWEIVVGDDATTDGSVDAAREVFPDLRVVRSETRLGCPAAKDFAVRAARGRVLVVIDGHCKPQPCSLERLIEDIEELGDTAVVTPRIPSLDAETWENDGVLVGHGFGFDLEDMACEWIPFGQLEPRGRFFETPAGVGCCLAMSRALYESVGGFDKEMVEWGVEDVDFSLKVWLLGHSILHDPAPAIGHRFRSRFDNYTVASESVLANKIRMARKHFVEPVWGEWVERMRDAVDADDWEKAWSVYRRREASAELEREDLMSRRRRDEHWYAKRFGLGWPERRGS